MRIWLLILATTSIMAGGCGTHWHKYSPYHWHLQSHLKLPCTSVEEDSVLTTDQPESVHHPTIETVPLVEEGPMLNNPGRRSLVVPEQAPQRTSPTSHGDPLHRLPPPEPDQQLYFEESQQPLDPAISLDRTAREI